MMQGQYPRVWLVVGDKAGDNAQVATIAQALGWPVEWRRLVFRESYRTGKPKFEASLYHLDENLSDPLLPPWPDLVITVGRRPAMAALWIKQQAGGRTKVVILGRPKRYLERFDLVVVPAQYCVPERFNVHKLSLPLMRVDRGAVEAAVKTWRARLVGLPRPLVAVLVGGATKPYRMDAQVARRLLEQVQAATCGRGTFYISTSRRTPLEVVQTLADYKPANALLYRYGLDRPEDNPYLALLGLADGCIVTADSISMMVESLRLQKPLAIFPLPVQTARRLRLKRWVLKLAGGRDLSAMHRLLFERGWAVLLGQGEFPCPSPKLEVPDEVPEVVARIQSLLAR